MTFFHRFIASHSIRTLSTLTTLCITFPLLVVLIILGQKDYQEKKGDAARQAMELARQFSLKHDDMLLHARTMLETLAIQPGFVTQDSALLRTQFQRLNAFNPQYAYLTLAGTDGYLRASSSSTDTTTNFNDRDQFQATLNEIRFSIGRTIISRTTGLPVLPFAAPVTNAEGKVTGVFLLGLRIDEYERYFSNIGLPEGGRFVLFDDKGTRLLRYPTREISPTGQMIYPEVWETLSKNPEDSGTFEMKVEGNLDLVYAFIKLRPQHMKQGYTGILVGIPTPDWSKQFWLSYGIFWVMILVVTALALSIGGFLSSQIVASGLLSLRREISKISAGNRLDEIPGLTGCQEVLALGESLVSMSIMLAQDRHARDSALAVLRDNEEALKNERWRLANIIDGTRAGTWEWNIQTGETVFNDMWAEICGYTLEEMAPVSIETWMRLGHPDDLKQSEELLNQHFSGKSDYYDCECRMRHKNGLWIWVQDRGRVVTRTGDGKPLMMFGTHQDITDRKRIENALRESEDRYRTFFTSVEAVKLIIDPVDGLILDANPAAVDFYGYPLERILGMYIYEINTLPKTEVLDELAQVIQTGKKHFHFQHRIAGGDIRDVEVYICTIMHRGKVLVMSSIHDVTELRRLERIKDDVERIIRHDLKSPLNGLVNLPPLLLEDQNLTQDQRKIITLMGVSARKMLNQINSSLEIHKIENGTYRLKTEPCDPGQVVLENADMLAMGLRVKRGLIQVRDGTVREKGFSASTDKMLLDLVVMNLLRNALEASDPDAPVFVDLSVERGDLVLAVSNSQPVPLEIRDRFFEKYATVGKSGGTGLGTYSAFIMTKALGGTIGMETSDETGTKVTVRIPIGSRENAHEPVSLPFNARQN